MRGSLCKSVPCLAYYRYCLKWSELLLLLLFLTFYFASLLSVPPVSSFSYSFPFPLSFPSVSSPSYSFPFLYYFFLFLLPLTLTPFSFTFSRKLTLLSLFLLSYTHSSPFHLLFSTFLFHTSLCFVYAFPPFLFPYPRPLLLPRNLSWRFFSARCPASAAGNNIPRLLAGFSVQECRVTRVIYDRFRFCIERNTSLHPVHSATRISADRQFVSRVHASPLPLAAVR